MPGTSNMNVTWGLTLLACKTQNPCVLTTPAKALQLAWLATLKTGHSEGMAATSLRHYLDPTFAPSSLQAQAFFANELSIESVRRWFALTVVQNLAPRNAGQLSAAGVVSLPDSTPAEILDRLLTNLANPDATDRYWLQIAKSPTVRGGGWHSVVPYAVGQTSADEYLVYVYDPNVPGETDQALKITRSTNRWSYVSARAPDRRLYDYEGDAAAGNLRLVSWQWQNTTIASSSDLRRRGSSDLDGKPTPAG